MKRHEMKHLWLTNLYKIHTGKLNIVRFSLRTSPLRNNYSMAYLQLTGESLYWMET